MLNEKEIRYGFDYYHRDEPKSKWITELSEYDGESKRIMRKITVSSLMNEIAEAVAEVFSESFGQGEGFSAGYCRDVAGKIKHRITKYENRLKNKR